MANCLAKIRDLTAGRHTTDIEESRERTMAELTGKNVLITGALGTIGQALVARYAKAGASIIALDRPGRPPTAAGRLEAR
jgi:FlaA1/EpsC-like NDP-sugar epimerase